MHATDSFLFSVIETKGHLLDMQLFPLHSYIETFLNFPMTNFLAKLHETDFWKSAKILLLITPKSVSMLHILPHFKKEIYR